MNEDKKPPLLPTVKAFMQMNELVREAKRRAALKKAQAELEEVLERIKNKG